MKKEDNLLPKFYYPCCNKCKGVLKIYFNDNFTIDYECENNENHRNENIYFETFERFFLKEKLYDYCNKCNKNLESDNKYICKECKKMYCNVCFIYDEHIKAGINNLNIIKNKCSFHQGDLIYFCKTCKKYFCIKCLKANESGTHENHDYISILDFMPTINEIKNLEKKIIEKEKAYNDLINSLDEWCKELLKKVEKLKQKLKKEIDLLKKLFFNFNQNFANVAYCNNFNNIYNFIKNINNESLNKFYISNNLEFKTKYLFQYFFPSNDKIINKKGKLLFYSTIGEDGIILKLTDNIFFVYNSVKNNIRIYKHNINKEMIIFHETIEFTKKIYSLSSFIINDIVYIYACLEKKKKVNIFIYNLKNESLQLSDDIIIDENENDNSIEDSDNNSDNSNNYQHFYKCIQLQPNLIAITEYNTISIWKKMNDIESYSKQTILNNNIDLVKDIILIDNEYFACLLYSSSKYFIVYYSINNLNEEALINIIDCIDGHVSCLYLFKQYLLIRGNKGISILSNKTKDLIQYLDLSNNSYEIHKIMQIIPTSNDIIYILIQKDKSFFMEKYKYKDGFFIQFEEYKDIELPNDKNEILNSFSEFDLKDGRILNGYYINEDYIFLWKRKLYRFIKN